MGTNPDPLCFLGEKVNWEVRLAKKGKHAPKLATDRRPWPAFLGQVFGVIVILAVAWFLGGLLCGGT